MSEPERKPDIWEKYGVAVNASVLELHEGHEKALDRVAAMGAAAHAVRTGADVERVPLAAARFHVYGERMDERDVIAADLAPMLCHIRFGRQEGLLPAAIRLYARWLQRRAAFSHFDTEAHLLVLERFAARVLHEWLSDKCIACGGCRKQERTKQGGWIRPRGSMQRNATFRPCTACHGSGRALPNHAERAAWLELPRAWYESERWPQRFNAALTWLSQFHVDRIKRPLAVELERRRR